MLAKRRFAREVARRLLRGENISSSGRLTGAATGALRGVQRLRSQLRAVVVHLVLGVWEDVQVGRIRNDPDILARVESKLKRAGLEIRNNTDDLHVVVVLSHPIGGEALGVTGQQELAPDLTQHSVKTR